MKFRVLCLSTCLGLAVTFAAAQDNPFASSPGRHGGLGYNLHSLSGSVRTAAGQPVRNARVEVRTILTAQLVASGYTVPNGSFEFANLPPGNYEIVVTQGVNEARQRVDLNQMAGGVHLIIGSDTAYASVGDKSAVSISQLKVPEKARKLFAKAEEAFRKQNLSQAREQLEKALQAFPNYAQALTLRGILSLQDNRLDAACADLEQAVKDDYSYGMGYVALGATYNLMNRFDDSVRVLDRAVALSPSSWQAYFEFSKALLGKGQFEAALRQINKAGDLAPSNYPGIHLVRAHALLGIKDYNQAVAELEQFLGAQPGAADSAKARETLNQVRAFMAKVK
jgi:tetratricopeptide (TPR) repeat protein